MKKFNLKGLNEHQIKDCHLRIWSAFYCLCNLKIPTEGTKSNIFLLVLQQKTVDWIFDATLQVGSSGWLWVWKSRSLGFHTFGFSGIAKEGSDDFSVEKLSLSKKLKTVIHLLDPVDVEKNRFNIEETESLRKINNETDTLKKNFEHPLPCYYLLFTLTRKILVRVVATAFHVSTFCFK